MKKALFCITVIMLCWAINCRGAEVEVSGVTYRHISEDGLTSTDITGQGLCEGLVICSFTVQNNTLSNKQISMALVLYRKETPQSAPKMVDVIFIDKIIKSMDGDIIGAGFTVEDPQRLYMKTLLWNGQTDCTPYSASYIFASQGLSQ